MDALKIIAAESVKEQAPEFSVGDTVRVSVNIREGERERIQQFEGTVIARKGSGVAETFTVRRISYGVGVERVFPVHSPNVKEVAIIRKGKVVCFDTVENLKKKYGGLSLEDSYLNIVGDKND